MNPLKIEPVDVAHSDGTIRVLVAGNAGYRAGIAAVVNADDIALVDLAPSGDALLEKLASGGFDCIVTDETVGDRNTLELRELIEERIKTPPPMVMVTERSNLKSILKAFRNGISDFVSKDHDYGSELIQAVRRSVRRHRRYLNLVGEVEHLSRLANYDRLTGLPNRHFLEERLATLIASGDRHASQFAIFLIDINNFKQINDIHGHGVGDHALKAFARELMSTSRSSDALGRFGSDEFLYLIDRDVSLETVDMACQRLASALSFVVELDVVGLSLSASIGAAIFPIDGTTPDDLLTAADRAMFAAKQAGGGFRLAGTATTGPEMDRPFATAARSTIADGNGGLSHPARGGMSPDFRPEGPTPTGGVEGAVRVGGGDRVDHRDENRRVEHRNRVFKRGRIIFGDGFSTLDCIIRDLSSRGARITVEDQIAVPQIFSFALLDSGAIYSAVRRWQRGRSIGLEFSETAPDDRSNRTPANGARPAAGPKPRPG